MSRLRLQRENRRGHDPEAPAAAHRKLLEIKAVILLPAWAPKQMHGRLGGTCHKLHCKKITAYVSISQETRAASIGRNHAADAGIRAQIDRKEEIVRGSRFVELRESHARSDMRRAVDRIDLEGLDQDRKSPRLNSSH